MKFLLYLQSHLIANHIYLIPEIKVITGFFELLNVSYWFLIPQFIHRLCPLQEFLSLSQYTFSCYSFLIFQILFQALISQENIPLFFWLDLTLITLVIHQKNKHCILIKQFIIKVFPLYLLKGNFYN